ncbi:hypothetical protein AB3R30_07175 [Leptolyngbyaceae cyanobacterium UHCC 1019]
MNSNEQDPNYPSGYGGDGYGNDEETGAEVGYGKSGYGNVGYNGTGYSTEGYGGNAYTMQSAVDGSSTAFDPNPSDSGYTPTDVWSSGYQENVYDQAALLDTPYLDTAGDPNRGGNPAYRYSISDESLAHLKPITPSGFEQLELAVPIQPQQKLQVTEAQKAKEVEQLRRSQPKVYRSKVFDVELEL